MKKGLFFHLLLTLLFLAFAKVSSSTRGKEIEGRKRVLKANKEKKTTGSKNNYAKSMKGDKGKSGYKINGKNKSVSKGKVDSDDENENGIDRGSVTSIDTSATSSGSPQITDTSKGINGIQQLVDYSVPSNVEIIDAPVAINTVPFSNARFNKEAAEMEDLNDSMKALAEQEADERIKTVEEDGDMESNHITLKHYIVSGMTIFFLFTAYSLHRRYRVTLFSDRTETKMQQQDIEITSNEEVNPFLDRA